MSPLILAHLVLTSAYAGFQGTVRAVVYPQFAAVPAEAFPAYERSHQRRVSVVVGPLFGALVLTTGALLLRRPAGAPWPEVGAAAALLVVILGLTAFAAVPLHRRLSAGWDAAAFHRLLGVDLVRLLAALVNVAVAVVLAL